MNTPGAETGTAPSLTRDDILRAGQEASPWQFIPLALQALQQAPQDILMELLLAAAFLRLGLRTVAAEHLENLQPKKEISEQVQNLKSAAATMPDDRITEEELEQTLNINLEELAQRGIDISADIPRWRTEIQEREYFRTNDGNITVRSKGSRAWISFRPDRQQAEAADLPHFKSDDHARKPYILEGIDPPWLLVRIYETTPLPDGFSPRITVVQKDAAELMRGLCLADLRHIISDPRTRWIIGSDAAERLRETLTNETGLVVQSYSLHMANVNDPIAPDINSIVLDITRLQADEHRRLEKDLRDRYENRDINYWLMRYRSEEPLRILIPVSRFSTFVRYSAEDMRDTFRRLGHDCRIITEPDDYSRLTTPSYFREILRFDPDMVMCINYTRYHMGESIPQNIPFVTWIQDRMAHLFDREAGRYMGQLDWVIGHPYRELHEIYDYPVKRMTAKPVVVNADKFSPDPLPDSVIEPYRCEVAYVSHRSEPPQKMHERLREIAAGNINIQNALDSLYPQLQDLCRQVGSINLDAEPYRLLIDELSMKGVSNPPRDLTASIRTFYLDPLTEQMVRHETLQWAAEICKERGWRFHIYGKGWDQHPDLAEFAQPVPKHGRELRAAYQGAKIHLHASARTNLHQRVLEGFSSGTMMLCRLIYAEAVRNFNEQRREMMQKVNPAYGHPVTRTLIWKAESYPPAAEAQNIIARLGIWEVTRPDLIPISTTLQEQFRKTLVSAGELNILTNMARPEEWMFRDKEDLQMKLERFIIRPRERKDLIRENQEKIQDRWTYEAFARDLLGIITRDLAAI